MANHALPGVIGVSFSPLYLRRAFCPRPSELEAQGECRREQGKTSGTRGPGDEIKAGGWLLSSSNLS